MQNRYVGDVGDFGKYGLLRTLASPLQGDTGLAVGVIWYLVPDESNNGDGGRIGYLSLPANQAAFFRECDPPLYDTLRRLITDGRRDIRVITEAKVLPPGTACFGEPLSYSGMRSGATRRDHRARWLARAYHAMEACQVVFLDPDNGFGGAVIPHVKQGVKYTYPAEVRPLVERGQSVVVYHHLGRRGTAIEQLTRQFRAFGERRDWSVFAMLYHRGTARAFFIIEPSSCEHRLLHRAKKMLAGPWSRHFELVTTEGLLV